MRWVRWVLAGVRQAVIRPFVRPRPGQLPPSKAEGHRGAVAMQPLDDFLCPITGVLLVDPVILVQSGHSYERSAIEQWLATRSTDPHTNVAVTSRQLAPNITLRKAIAQWKQRKAATALPAGKEGDQEEEEVPAPAATAGSPTDFLRDSPQFQVLRRAVWACPFIMVPVMQELISCDSRLVHLINDNRDEFVSLLAGASEEDISAFSELIKADGTAETRLREGMGFDRSVCIEAYLQDQIWELAADYRAQHL